MSTELKLKPMKNADELRVELTQLTEDGFRHMLSTVHEESDQFPDALTIDQAIGFIDKNLTVYSERGSCDVFRTCRNRREGGYVMYEMDTY